ncbi:tyrosine-type recombinase/integrase [Phaeovulum sp. NW3]|uniref:tyrosine-type recombinase/integrase n=1 Tax=Phaeovulum sp. NW3 TaxID=2934933 RepID=UPI002021B221|nr:tyrosine-type recombinase/integrase [Phaeovulum sp. NW3]
MKRKKYLWKHPSGRWYVRKGGRYYRIYASEGTPEFDDEYWSIVRGKRHAARRSWSVLIAELRKTDKWAGYEPRYREDLEGTFTYLEERIGKRDVRQLTKADIYNAMDKNTHRVRFANYIPVAISMLAKLGQRKGWLKDNPATDIELLKVPEDRKKPHIPWTDAAVETWRREAFDLPMLIFELGVGSVQRPGDLNAFTWRQYEDGQNLKITQSKTGVELLLPCTLNLQAQLDRLRAELGERLTPDRPILANDDGSPMSYYKIARIMRAERERLGVLEHDLHAMRYRGVMELAWAGCDDDEIMSFSGHKTKKMVIKYAGFARQVMRATTAAEKRQLWERLLNETRTKSETDTKGDTL